MTPRSVPLSLVACAVVVACAIVALYGCGGGAAQSALSLQASVIVANRGARVEFYESQHTRCLASTTGTLSYRDCMAPARHIARAADSYRESLYAAQAVLDATGEASAGGAIACAIEAARRLASALEEAAVPVPAEIGQVAAFIPEGICHAAE